MFKQLGYTFLTTIQHEYINKYTFLLETFMLFYKHKPSHRHRNTLTCLTLLPSWSPISSSVFLPGPHSLLLDQRQDLNWISSGDLESRKKTHLISRCNACLDKEMERQFLKSISCDNLKLKGSLKMRGSFWKCWDLKIFLQNINH